MDLSLAIASVSLWFSLHAAIGGVAAAPTIQLDRGTFVGSSTGTVDKFLGIPFALPPYVRPTRQCFLGALPNAYLTGLVIVAFACQNRITRTGERIMPLCSVTRALSKPQFLPSQMRLLARF